MTTDMRTCKQCGVPQPLSEYYFAWHKRANGRRHGAPRARCKSCTRDAQRTTRVCPGCGQEWQHRGSAGGRVRVCPQCVEVGSLCSTCNEFKPLDAFHGRRTGHRCIDCTCLVQTCIRYGITVEEYRRLFAAQGGRCAVCGEQDGRLNVDHDHTTGNVRGLLCGLCNRALGQAGDDPDRLLGLAAYLIQNTDVLRNLDKARG